MGLWPHLASTALSTVRGVKIFSLMVSWGVGGGGLCVTVHWPPPLGSPQRTGGRGVERGSWSWCDWSQAQPGGRTHTLIPLLPGLLVGWGLPHRQGDRSLYRHNSDVSLGKGGWARAVRGDRPSQGSGVAPWSRRCLCWVWEVEWV